MVYFSRLFSGYIRQKVNKTEAEKLCSHSSLQYKYICSKVTIDVIHASECCSSLT